MTVNHFIQKASGRAGVALQWAKRIPLKLRSGFITIREAVAEEDDLGPSIRERQEELAVFYTRYEELVEVLCDAAQYGPDSPLTKSYDELRTYMQASYPVMKKFVLAFLDLEVEDAQGDLAQYGHATDAFEALYYGPTLEFQIRSDDGRMIGRIMRTREALNRYAEHLRRQAA